MKATIALAELFETLNSTDEVQQKALLNIVEEETRKSKEADNEYNRLWVESKDTFDFRTYFTKIPQSSCPPENYNIPDVEDNLALISKAKLKNSPAVIMVTAYYPEEEEEPYKAGADYVILPHILGGKHVAHLLSEHSRNLEEYLYAKRKTVD